MNREEIIELLICRFYENFADKVAEQISVSDANTQILYSLSVSYKDIEPSKRNKVGFRSAYVLERIYFNYPERFIPLREQFIKDFPCCANASARRHFGKIMTHLLQTYQPTNVDAELIAQSAASWAVEPNVRVAVKIWAVEVLKSLKGNVSWINDVWEDIIAVVANNETPAIIARKRRWK